MRKIFLVAAALSAAAGSTVAQAQSTRVNADVVDSEEAFKPGIIIAILALAAIITTIVIISDDDDGAITPVSP